MELAHVTLVTPRIMRWLPDFRKKFVPLSIVVVVVIIIIIIFSCYCYDGNTLPVSVRGRNLNSDGYENRRINE